MNQMETIMTVFCQYLMIWSKKVDCDTLMTLYFRKISRSFFYTPIYVKKYDGNGSREVFSSCKSE